MKLILRCWNLVSLFYSKWSKFKDILTSWSVPRVCSLLSGSADRLLDRFPLKLCFGDSKLETQQRVRTPGNNSQKDIFAFNQSINQSIIVAPIVKVWVKCFRFSRLMFPAFPGFPGFPGWYFQVFQADVFTSLPLSPEDSWQGLGCKRKCEGRSQVWHKWGWRQLYHDATISLWLSHHYTTTESRCQLCKVSIVRNDRGSIDGICGMMVV